MLPGGDFLTEPLTDEPSDRSGRNGGSDEGDEFACLFAPQESGDGQRSDERRQWWSEADASDHMKDRRAHGTNDCARTSREGCTEREEEQCGEGTAGSGQQIASDEARHQHGK